VPPQDVITRDNVSVKVNAVIHFRVLQADRAFLRVADFLFATSQFAHSAPSQRSAVRPPGPRNGRGLG
jgi:regulator of protease activity HflC (stomatin/prohibitin superfamily)